jgi:hypothetical protein
LHGLLRKVYDVVGKRLARLIRTSFLADVAYLSLKPFEWCAGFVLKLIVPEIESITDRTYTN